MSDPSRTPAHQVGSDSRTTPSPDGEPLTLRLRCWTSRAPRATYVRHNAVLYPDWSVQVPHDLATERLAQAFGGWLSCLDLERTTLPAARRWLDLTLRSVLPPVRLGASGGEWHVEPQQTCCPRAGHPTAADAFAHACDLRHLAVQFDCDRMQLHDLVQALGSAHGVHEPGVMPADLADAAAAGLTHGRRDVGHLWKAGVHPRHVVDVRERLGLTGRLPRSFYFAVLTRRPDLDWMRATLDRAGHDDDASTVTSGGVVLDASQQMSLPEWLAWTHAEWDDDDPTARSRWLELGVTRQVLLGLAGHGYSPEQVAALAAALGRTPNGAARHLVAWLACGVEPSIPDLVALHLSGRAPLWYAPTPVVLLRAMDALTHDTDRALVSGIRCREGEVDRLRVAFLLAVCGNVPDTVSAYRAGRTWRDDPLTEENIA